MRAHALFVYPYLASVSPWPPHGETDCLRPPIGRRSCDADLSHAATGGFRLAVLTATSGLPESERDWLGLRAEPQK